MNNGNFGFPKKNDADLAYESLVAVTSSRGGVVINESACKETLNFLNLTKLFNRLNLVYGASYGMKLSGASVSEIYNLISAGNCLGQSRQNGGTSDPTLDFYNANGLPGFNFVNASAQRFDLDCLNRNPRKFTATFVVKTPDALTGRCIFGHRSEAGNALFYLYALGGVFSFQARSNLGTDFINLESPAYSLSTVYVVTFKLDAINSFHSLRVNGLRVAESSQNYSGGSFYQLNQTLGGVYQPSIASTYDGLISECFIFEDSIEDEEIVKLERFLGNRYSVQVY